MRQSDAFSVLILLLGVLVILFDFVIDRVVSNSIPVSVYPRVLIEGCQVVDGDTIRCGRLSIRLVGYDAFESCEPGGTEATEALAKHLDDLRLRFLGKDVYGRSLASGTWRGRPLAEEMGKYQRDKKIPRPRCVS